MYRHGVTAAARELLPHVFTLAGKGTSPLPPAVVFCYTNHKLTPICAFHREVLFAVRTFLTATGATEQSTFKPQIYKKSRSPLRETCLNYIAAQLILEKIGNTVGRNELLLELISSGAL